MKLTVNTNIHFVYSLQQFITHRSNAHWQHCHARQQSQSSSRQCATTKITFARPCVRACATDDGLSVSVRVCIWPYAYVCWVRMRVCVCCPPAPAVLWLIAYTYVRGHLGVYNWQMCLRQTPAADDPRTHPEAPHRARRTATATASLKPASHSLTKTAPFDRQHCTTVVAAATRKRPAPQSHISSSELRSAAAPPAPVHPL